MVVVRSDIGPHHYEVVGKNEDVAAREFQSFLKRCEREIFFRGDMIVMDIRDKRRFLETKYAVEIRTESQK